MASKPSAVKNRRVSSRLFERTDEPDPVKPAVVEKPARVKRTFHLDRDAVLLLEELQVQRHRATGSKPELSQLVTEAIRLLGQSDHSEVQAS